MTPPYWITDIQERMKLLKKHPFTIEQTEAELNGIGITPEWSIFYANSELGLPALLSAYLKMREAVENVITLADSLNSAKHNCDYASLIGNVTLVVEGLHHIADEALNFVPEGV